MADVEETAPFVGNRIPASIGSDARPDKIIFRELTPEVRQGWINITYLEDNKPVQGDIAVFIRDLLKKPETTESVAAAPMARPDPISPLDLNCKTDCYLVFKLAEGWNWQFADSGDCFTTKKPHGGKYSDLVHVMPDGTEIGSGKPIGDGCMIVYVRARGKNANYKDGFNLTVELLVGEDRSGAKRRTQIIIDPDIRNPGGGGEP